MKILKICIGLIVSVYVLIGACLFMFQRDFVYFPTEETPHAYQTEKLSINEESINVVVVNSEMSDAILYFGGNGETVANMAPDFAKTFPNHTVYLVNYRGYGGSSGIPTENNLYTDASAIYDLVTIRHKNLSVIGRSLGTGVATYLASTKVIHKLVLVTPFDSAEHIAQDQYPFYPISILFLDKYNSFDRVDKIKSPTLIILAEKDLEIPAKYSSRLIGKFPTSQIEVSTIKETGHNNIIKTTTYLSLLDEFI